jgi:hypothetical protein
MDAYSRVRRLCAARVAIVVGMTSSGRQMCCVCATVSCGFQVSAQGYRVCISVDVYSQCEEKRRMTKRISSTERERGVGEADLFLVARRPGAAQGTHLISRRRVSDEIGRRGVRYRLWRAW